jgi:hypothetical protein
MVTSTELRSSQVRTIDLLPADLEVWTHADVTEDPERIRIAAEDRLVGVVSETFYQRGYQVGAVLDWDGRYVGADGAPQIALAQPMLLATVDSLASYGTFVGNSHTLPDPILPARLGTTGSDATLYVGGWGFAGKEPDRGKVAGKIVLGVVLVAVVVVAVVAIAALAKSKSDPVGKLAGGSARAAGRVAASVGRTALRAGTAIVDLGRAVPADLLEGAVEVAVAAPLPPPPQIPQRPVWSNDKTLPRTGRPKMYLEMTLVDNRTGRVLWHAHQGYPANPARPHDVMRAAKHMLASLPPP